MSKIVCADIPDATLAEVERFIDGEPLADIEQAVRILCITHAVVSHSGVTRFPDVAADCFCGAGPYRGADWRNDGESIRFIVRAVLDALDDRVAA